MLVEPKTFYREHRQHAHHQVIVSARGFGRYFLVKNASRSGAGLAGEKQLRIGEPVTLDFEGTHIDATVRWVKDRETGVKFSRRLHIDDFRALMKQFRAFKKAT